MSQNKHSYNRADVVKALRSVGIEKGDSVFFHLSLGMFGLPAGVLDMTDLCFFYFEAVREALGQEGTILIPTYSYTLPTGKVFDPEHTGSTIGPFTEFFRKQPGVVRSCEPILSVAGLGPKAQEYLTKLPRTSYGEDSLYARMVRNQAKICTLGLGLHWATFRHHAEEMAAVPFRYKKVFVGQVQKNNQIQKECWVYSVRILSDNGSPDAQELAKKALMEGVSKVATLGRAQIFAVGCKEYFDYCLNVFRSDPWISAKGPEGNPIELELDRVRAGKPVKPVEKLGDLFEISRWVGQQPLHCSWEASTVLWEYARRRYGFNVHYFQSGEERNGWIIPEKWTLNSFSLVPMDSQDAGSELPNLEVLPFSKKFEGEVSLEELKQHVFTRDMIDRKRLILQAYERQWGFVLEPEKISFLKAERYAASIASDFSFSKVGYAELVVEGQSRDSIIIYANLNSFQRDDWDMSGITVAMEVASQLKTVNKLGLTCRIILTSEFLDPMLCIGDSTDDVIGCIVLQQLDGMGKFLMHSFPVADSQICSCARLALLERGEKFVSEPFSPDAFKCQPMFKRGLSTIPMVALSRKEGRDRGWNIESVQVSCKIVMQIVQFLCEDKTPYPIWSSFLGPMSWESYEVFSRVVEHASVFYALDGVRTESQIAKICDLDLNTTRSVLHDLESVGALRWS